jgi:nucleotide-binding universal stress UspA family protein
MMRIVIGVDGSAASRAACDFVAGRSWPAGTHVRLVAVVEPPALWIGLPEPNGGSIEAQQAELQVTLDERADELRRGGLGCELVVEVGRPAEVLIGHASEWFADLIVVGSRGLGTAASALLGSVSAHLVDHAPCPVLVMRSASVSRMLLATDGTRSSIAIPRILATWSPGFDGLPVEVVSIASSDERPPAAAEGAGLVASEPGALPDAGLVLHRRIAGEVADEMMELGWRAAAVARAGDPGREIVSAAEGWGADLIVTGSRGLGTVQRLLVGSVAHSVLLHANASVLVVRGQVVARKRAAAIAVAALG